jgi:hypothetical protein
MCLAPTVELQNTHHSLHHTHGLKTDHVRSCPMAAVRFVAADSSAPVAGIPDYIWY